MPRYQPRHTRHFQPSHNPTQHADSAQTILTLAVSIFNPPEGAVLRAVRLRDEDEYSLFAAVILVGPDRTVQRVLATGQPGYTAQTAYNNLIDELVQRSQRSGRWRQDQFMQRIQTWGQMLTHQIQVEAVGLLPDELRMDAVLGLRAEAPHPPTEPRPQQPQLSHGQPNQIQPYDTSPSGAHAVGVPPYQPPHLLYEPSNPRQGVLPQDLRQPPSAPPMPWPNQPQRFTPYPQHGLQQPLLPPQQPYRISPQQPRQPPIPPPPSQYNCRSNNPADQARRTDPGQHSSNQPANAQGTNPPTQGARLSGTEHDDLCLKQEEVIASIEQAASPPHLPAETAMPRRKRSRKIGR